MAEFSGKFNVYKKSSALQLSLEPASREQSSIKEGAVFLEVAIAAGQNDKGNTTYAWDNKIVIALGVPDIQKLIISKDVKLVHKNPRDDSVKSLALQPGKTEGTYGLHLNAGEKKVSVFMDEGEFFVFRRLLADSIPDILGWRL